MSNKPTPAGRDIARVVPGPTQLKALAHPERLRMLGLLRLEGPATATRLARRMGLNSGATSYHLRQLAAHGFIETAEDLGNRRERWWRASHESTLLDTAEMEGEDFEAGQAMTQSVLSWHASQMQRAHDAYGTLPHEWRKASTASDFTMALTADEAHALTERMMELLWEVKAKTPAPGEPLPEGARPFTVLVHAFPYPGLDAPEPPEDET